MRTVVVILVLLVVGSAGAAGYFQYEHRRALDESATDLTGGRPSRGHQKIAEYGCTACHDIPGFRGTRAFVGPPLEHFAFRMYVGGAAENKPENVIEFLKNPRGVVQHGAMPNLHVTDADARDIAAYLYTLE